MAVTPVSEGAAELDVAKAFEPAEFFDEGVPCDANGGEGNGAEGKGKARAIACGDLVGAKEGIRWWGWCDQGGLFDAGVLPGGHESGEVGWVCEEGEDLLDGVGQPLLRVEVKVHGFHCECNGVTGAARLRMVMRRSKFSVTNDGVPKDAIAGRKFEAKVS